MKRLNVLATALILAASTLATLCAQTLMPLPPFGSTFSSTTLTRGLWFQAPLDFTITGLRVPDESGAGVQNIEVFIMTSPPPAYTATASGGSVHYVINQPSATILPVNISITSGQYVGILGACGTTTMRNSYATGGPFATTIGGMPVTISRFLTQNNIFSAPAPNYSSSTGAVSRVEMYYEIGPSCLITAPIAAATVSANVDITFDANHPMSLPLDATLFYTTDAGASFQVCTPVSGTNPIVGIITPATGITFQWNSLADQVGRMSVQPTTIRINVSDGAATGLCTVDIDVDNVPAVPTCALILNQPSPVNGDAALELTPDSVNSPVVDALYEFSTDAGATFALATPRSGTNPQIGLAVLTPSAFIWDTRADSVGVAAIATGVIVRATVNDGVSLVDGQCTTAPFDVDNTALCSMICGDCNLDSAGPSIIDALVGAQISAGLIVPTMLQIGCCDTNSSMNVDIIDALLMAQSSAGLPVTLTCL